MSERDATRRRTTAAAKNSTADGAAVTGQTTNPRARALGDSQPANGGQVGEELPPGRPDAEERDRLVATLGATLKALRAEYRLSTPALAKRAATTRSTVTRLEGGQRRPRRSMLNSLAIGFDPDRQAELRDLLVAAAGTSLVPESPHSERIRGKRLATARLAGEVPMPSAIAVPMALHRAADEEDRIVEWLLSAPANLTNAVVLAEAESRMKRADELRKQAGPPFSVTIGSKTIMVGYGLDA